MLLAPAFYENFQNYMIFIHKISIFSKINVLWLNQLMRILFSSSISCTKLENIFMESMKQSAWLVVI
jgi:hypothetical protein